MADIDVTSQARGVGELAVVCGGYQFGGTTGDGGPLLPVGRQNGRNRMMRAHPNTGRPVSLVDIGEQTQRQQRPVPERKFDQ